MSISTKNNKIIFLISEQIKTSDNKYLLNGIDLSKARFYYKEDLENFYELVTSDYEVFEESGNTFLKINNTEINSIVELFQIAYELNFTGGQYDPTFDVDIEVLKDNYNKLVEDSKNIWEILKKQVFVADSLDENKILPALQEGEIWVKTSDGWKGITVVDFQKQISDALLALNSYTTLKENQLDNFEKDMELELGNHVETVNKVELNRYVEEVNKIELNNFVEQVNKVDLLNYTGVQKQALDDKFDELKQDNGIIPESTISINELTYGRWWTDNITTFLDTPINMLDSDISGAVEVTISDNKKVFKFYTTNNKVFFKIETGTGYTKWALLAEDDNSSISFGFLGSDYKFTPIKWDSELLTYVKATSLTGADAISVNCDTNKGYIYYDSKVKIPTGSLDDKGNIFENGHYYFLSQTIDGKFQKELPTTGIWQPMFQVLEFNNELFAIIEIESLEDITPVLTDIHSNEYVNVLTKEEVIAEGNTQVDRIESEKDDSIAEIEAKKNSSIASVEAKRVSSVADVEAVKTSVELMLEGEDVLGNALSLSGKTREQYDTKIEANTEQIQNLSRNIILPIVHGAGLMDFSIEGGSDVMWKLADGTISYSTRPVKTLPAGTSYLYCSNLWANGVAIKSNGTNKNYVGKTSDLSNLTYSASFNNTEVTGDIASLSNLTYYASFNNTEVTGDIASLSNLTYYASFYGTQVYGILTPTPTLTRIYLTDTNLTTNDVDQSVINLNNVTTITNGILSIFGLTRTIASTAAINALVAKGWSVTDATVI
jgi:hypothetical protein